MLLRTVRGGEWSQFLDYLSPSFLDVMPISSLISQGRELTRNAMGGARFDEQLDKTRRHLNAAGISVRLDAEVPSGKPQPVSELSADQRRQLGQQALQIYFGQLFWSPAAIMDLRSTRFAVDPESHEASWFPRSLYVTWDPKFLGAIRELYMGFYREDRARFDAALDRLELRAAGDVLLGHFGEGDQSKVRFTTQVFHSTFHTAFVRCRDAGVSLHPNFLALGIYLACLYDLLESLDLEFDVRDAFERVASA